MAARLHVHESDVGVIFSTSFLSASLGIVLAGRAFDTLGARLMLPCGLAAMALGVLGEGLAPTLLLLALASALAGAGIGIINVGVNTTAGLLYPERREGALNALNALFGCGAFLAPLLVDASLTRLDGYLPAYVVTAALLAVPIVPLWWGLPPLRHDGVSAERGPRLGQIARRLWAPAGMGFLYLGVEVGFGGWIVAIAQRLDGLSATAAAPIAALFWLFLALGGVPTALLLHRGVAPARIVGMGALGAGLVALLLAVAGALTPLAVVCAALMGLALAPIFPLTLAWAGRTTAAWSPDDMAGATSFVLVVSQVGAAILPPLQGFLLRAGPAPALVMTALGALLILPIQRAALRRQR